MNVWWSAIVLPLLMLTDASVSTRLSREAEIARLELEAAETGSPYFVLDIAGGKLGLRLKGVELRSYDLQSVELGKLPFSGSATPASEVSWCDFELSPVHPRKEIQPDLPTIPSPSQAGEAEENLPSSFFIRCGLHLAIRFLSESWHNGWSSLTDRLRKPGEPQDAMRLRVRVPDSDIKELYQAMPDRGKLLLVMPPEQ